MPEFSLQGTRPRVHPEAWIAPTAVLIGDVEVGPGASVWFGAVLRADNNRIVVGAGSNIQDQAVVHCTDDRPTLIGAGCTLGHRACIEGCTVEDGALVGTAAVMLAGTRLGAGAVLAAGAVLQEGREIPAGHLAAGVPAVDKGALRGPSSELGERTAGRYRRNAGRFREGLRVSPE